MMCRLPSTIELTELIRSRKADVLRQYTACWTAMAQLCNVRRAKREAYVKFGYWRAVRVLIATGLVVGTSLAASAQQPTSEQISAIRSSCRSDFMAQCAGVQPGTRDALECLKRNAAKVSPPCKAALDAVGPRPAENAAPGPTPAPAQAKPASSPAAAAPPPPSAADEPPAAAAEPAASPAPGPAAAEGRKPPSPQVAAIRAACRSDFGVHCPGVKPGGSAALRCLQANAAALSPRCRNAVMARDEGMGEGGAPPPPGAGAAPEAAAPPAVAPLGPIPPMRPRLALHVLSFCGPEQRALCGNVPPGGGRIIECLAANYAHLSPECYGALARAAR
jgi:hypothetical protein